MGHHLSVALKGLKQACTATPRELETLRNIWAGLSNKGIAGAMQCSPKTVEAYRAKLNRKLNVHNTAGLLREGLRRKWIDAKA